MIGHTAEDAGSPGGHPHHTHEESQASLRLEWVLPAPGQAASAQMILSLRGASPPKPAPPPPLITIPSAFDFLRGRSPR